MIAGIGWNWLTNWREKRRRRAGDAWAVGAGDWRVSFFIHLFREAIIEVLTMDASWPWQIDTFHETNTSDIYACSVCCLIWFAFIGFVCNFLRNVGCADHNAKTEAEWYEVCIDYALGANAATERTAERYEAFANSWDKAKSERAAHSTSRKSTASQAKVKKKKNSGFAAKHVGNPMSNFPSVGAVCRCGIAPRIARRRITIQSTQEGMHEPLGKTSRGYQERCRCGSTDVLH